MQPISKTRIAIVLLVTILSFLMVIGTARYYMFLRQPIPKTTSQRPEFKTPPPPESETVAYANWEKDNPAYAQWLKDNKEYLAWEARSEELRKGAIPLGLDLIGGVDVALVIDRDRAIANEINNIIDSLKDRFDNEQVGAVFEPRPNGFTVKLNQAGDGQKAHNIVQQYSGEIIQAIPSADALASGAPVLVELNQAALNRAIKGDMEGAKKGIMERVDQLGVTQPRVSMQGEDRIRVQVPGEKDPDRLLANVIRPANLEFHMVDPRNAEIIEPGPGGKVRPGAAIPPGTEVRLYKDGKLDPETGTIKYTESQILINKRAELTGKELRRAGVLIQPEDLEHPVQVSLEFNDEGARKFADLTRANVGKQLAIVLDDVVRSAPVLEVPITDGRAVIRGGFSQEEAADLSQILKAGSLKAPLKIESKRTVGATLGADSIRSGVNALLLGSAIIIAIMVAWYSTAGFIAVLALILNIVIVLALMALSKATLTLSGIGGILLTVGMAVDGNILIYERMREELRAGKPLKQAIHLGFHRAFSAILDSHLTVLLTALVLMQFTEGSVFGFALTMTFGLLANLFTGLTFTYTLCGLWFQKFGSLSLGRFSILENPNIDFIKMRWFSWSLSTAIGVIAMIAVFAKGGVDFGVDFEGGYRSEVKFNKPVEPLKVRDTLTDAGLKDVYVQEVTNQANYYIIDMKLLVPEGKDVGDLDLTQNHFNQVMQKAFPEAGSFKVEASSGFGPQTSQEFRTLALWVTLLSALSILVYLWVRFELVFGVAAVISLLHDLVIVFFIACLLGVQVNLEVVAAMMVLMGLSVNDTIVIFDRIRENTRIMAGKSFGEICNAAMNQTLSRTLMTSGGVIIAAMCLLIVGGEGLRSFAIIYLIGVIVGTYSSDFIAAPILYEWNKRKGDRVRQMLSQTKKKKEIAKPIRQQA